MTHRRIDFAMPASASVTFDAFHYHQWRHRWDSLVGLTTIVGGGECPYVGAITENVGGGLLRALSMRTRFIAFAPPNVAAAQMIGHSFPFVRWAASMRHQDQSPDHSVLIYTYSFVVGPPQVAWLIRPIVNWLFERQTRKRFDRLAAFLTIHSQEIQKWQQKAQHE